MTRTVSNGGIGADVSLNGTTHFYYSGWRVMEERTVNGSLEPLARQYTWGNYLDEVWTIDSRSGGITVANLNDGTGGERHFALANTLYSVHGLADEEGNLVEAYEYDAYGRHTVRRPGGSATEVAFDATDDVVAGGASAHGNPFGYTGQRFDAETGLMYYKNRYYSPELGRFMSRDPLGAWFDPYSLGSAYAYGGAFPTESMDPYGLNVVKRVRDCLRACRAGAQATAELARISRELTSLIRANRSLKRQIREHQEKISQYRRNPNAVDNQGHLRRNQADPERQQRIRESRIRGLENSIDDFESQIRRNQSRIDELIRQSKDILGKLPAGLGCIIAPNLMELYEGGDYTEQDVIDALLEDIIYTIDPGFGEIDRWLAD